MVVPVWEHGDSHLWGGVMTAVGMFGLIYIFSIKLSFSSRGHEKSKLHKLVT